VTVKRFAALYTGDLFAALLSFTNTLHRAVARALTGEGLVLVPAGLTYSRNHFNIIRCGRW
jgi:hypothetical protein